MVLFKSLPEQIYTDTDTHTHTHTRTHARAHTHTHTHTPPSPLRELGMYYLNDPYFL